MTAEWSSSLDTPDAVDLVRTLGALFGGAVHASADAIEAAMHAASMGEGEDHHLDTEVGPLRVAWRNEDVTTTDVLVEGPDGAIALLWDVFDPEDPGLTSEALYRHGASLWSRRQLEPAARVLSRATVVADRDPLLAWGPAIDRALAQIGLELDDPDLAEQHLRSFQPLPVSAFQHLALESRLRLLRGDDEGAAHRASAAFALISRVALDDVADLMNTSIGLVHTAEVLLELCYATSAGRLASLGRSFVAQAGVDDPVVSSMLALCAARAAGISGDASTAARLLAEVDVALDPDLEVQVRAEEARGRWREGDVAGARMAFDAAIELASGADLRATARLLAAERDESSPRDPREEPGPLETWTGGAEGADDRPYAVVVSLVVEGVLDRYVALEDRVLDLLGQRPALGSVDGTGSDGTVWDLFLDGDDGEALWAAVEPLVVELAPPRGSTVRVRVAGGDVVERPLHP